MFIFLDLIIYNGLSTKDSTKLFEKFFYDSRNSIQKHYCYTLQTPN